MKIWLDDVRRPPNDSWVWVDSAHDFKDTLANFAYMIDEISFDHDIASYDAHGNEITGYHCLCWIEQLVRNTDFKPPIMHVHSANPVGRMKMQKVIDQLNGRMTMF